METNQPQTQYEFEIDASVVYQLGEMLISDEVQALVELVKNSYDADASYANIVVWTSEPVGNQSPKFPDALGYIIVEDDGIGMDWEDIKRGWLTISRSLKREMKQKHQKTGRGRTPVGEKGLGRLGTQRLGRYLELRSTKDGTNTELYVGLDWGDFRDKLLSNVPVYVAHSEMSRRGTRLSVLGLRAPEVWTGTAQRELANQLSQLLSPFESLRPFEVFLEINGKRLDLDRISHTVLDLADVQIGFSFDGQYLTVDGKYRPTFLRPLGQGPDSLRQYQELVAADNGANFFSFLIATNQTPPYPLTWEDQPGWLLSFHHKIALSDIATVQLVGETALSAYSSQQERGSVANPGPFDGEMYAFPRRDLDLDTVDVFKDISEYRRFLDRIAGVRVFRDGFGIRPFGLEGNDWLGLGKTWTSGASWYGMRPQNVIGYVALTAAHNSQLEETTSREYFVENAYSQNFNLLMGQVVEAVNKVNGLLRRTYSTYQQEKAKQELSITAQGVGPLLSKMRDTGNKSIEAAQQVSAAHQRIAEVTQRVGKITQDIELSPLFFTEAEHNAAPLLGEINRTLSEAQTILDKVESIISETQKLGLIADVIEPDFEYLRDQLVQFSELAGLGITAEALSHEMKIIADGLAARTTNLVARLRASQAVDPQVLAYTEFVHAAIAGFRKQLSHLDPSLRYVRDRRDEISMSVFFSEIQDFYQERLGRGGIRLEIDEPFTDFAILMNRGKLTQVFDNLVLNSEFWLLEDLRKTVIQEAKICVRIQKPFVEIYDTGRGVSPSVENQLFQPFVTTKPKGLGRGLGLFINRQLLESSNCQISLLPVRNIYDRRYIFRIDFTGALHK